MAYRTPPLLPPTAIVSLIVLISAYNIVNTINPVNQPKSATDQSSLVSKIKSESASKAARSASSKPEPSQTSASQRLLLASRRRSRVMRRTITKRPVPRVQRRHQVRQLRPQRRQHLL